MRSVKQASKTRAALLSYISDAHKDVYGFRPRADSIYNDMSEWDLKEEAAMLSAQVKEQIDEENALIERRRVKFENSIVAAMAAGAETRKDAIRWLREATNDQDIMHDDEYARYHFGLGYDYDFTKTYYYNVSGSGDIGVSTLHY